MLTKDAAVHEALRILREHGGQYITDAQALSILLEVDLERAEEIVAHVGQMQRFNLVDWSAAIVELGLTDAQARRLTAGITFARRINAEREMAHVGSPQDAFNLFVEAMPQTDKECFFVAILNTKNKVIKVELLYIGSANQIPIRPCEVIRPAVQHGAVAMVIGHNHPSNDPTPSPEDVRATEDLASAAKLLGIDLLDHVVFTQTRFVSLKERRLGPWNSL